MSVGRIAAVQAFALLLGLGCFSLALGACEAGISTGNAPALVDGGSGVGPNGGPLGGDAASDGGDGAGRASETGGDGAGPSGIKTVFLIMMENHSWSTIQQSDKAPYINDALTAIGGHAEGYSTPPGNHPSELNYIWLESGGTLGITTDDPPALNHRPNTDHLVSLLTAAGVSWKAYAEEATGADCPLTDQGKFVTRHIPMLFFDDVTGKNDPKSPSCIAHVRPYGELATDLAAGTVARYNFITPNLCDDMHGLTLACGTTNFDEVGAGDTWLKNEVPKILASDAYKNDGVLFIVWDEGDETVVTTASDGPIPFFVLSPRAKQGYTSTTKLTHSAVLRTVQEIFGVTPLLRDAQNSPDLAEFFTTFP